MSDIQMTKVPSFNITREFSGARAHLRTISPNTEVFLHILMWVKQILVWATGIQKENWGYIAEVFFGIIKRQFFQKCSKMQSNLWCLFFQIRVLLSLKMHGDPQFSFWIPRALAKFCLLRIVQKHPCIRRHHP